MIPEEKNLIHSNCKGFSDFSFSFWPKKPYLVIVGRSVIYTKKTHFQLNYTLCTIARDFPQKKSGEKNCCIVFRVFFSSFSQINWTWSPKKWPRINHFHGKHTHTHLSKWGEKRFKQNYEGVKKGVLYILDVHKMCWKGWVSNIFLCNKRVIIYNKEPFDTPKVPGCGLIFCVITSITET